MTPGILNHLTPRTRRRLAWVLAVFALYSLAGFLLLPVLLKWQLLRHLPGLTHREVTVGKVRVNPWTLSLSVQGLGLKEQDGRPFASWDEFYVNFQVSSLFRWAWTFREIRLVRPTAEVILFEDGRLNLANLFEPPPGTPAPPPRTGPATIPRVQIQSLLVTNGFVALEDRARRTVFRTEYRPINLHLDRFTTRPDTDTPYAFRAESDAGRSVTWAGDLTVQPLRSAGRLEVTGVILNRYQPYVEDFTHAVLTNGVAELALDYRLAVTTNGLDLVVSNTLARVADLQLRDPATGDGVVAVPEVEVRDAGFNLRDRLIHLGSVTAGRAALLIKRDPGGRLNLLDLLAVPSATNAPPSPAPPATGLPWTLVLETLAIREAAVSFEDRTLTPPFVTELKPIEVTLRDLSTRPDARGRYSFRIDTEAAETLSGEGAVGLNPPGSEGEVRLRTLDVKKYLPYVAGFFRGRVLAGQFEATAPYRAAFGSAGLEAGVTNLSLKLSGLDVQLPAPEERVLHVEQIGLERVEADWAARRARIGLWSAEGGSVLVRRAKDGAVNLLGLLAVTGTPAPRPAAETGTQPPLAVGGWTVDLDRLALENYTVAIEDHVPVTPVRLVLDQVRAEVTEASTAPERPVRASLSFRLNETAAVAVQGRGTIQPLAVAADLGVTNLPLAIAQPYLDPLLNLDLQQGLLDLSSTASWQPADSGLPAITLAGRCRVRDLRTAIRGAGQPLVGWETLEVTGIDAATQPPRLNIGEVRLAGARAGLRIDPDGTLNVARLRPETAPPPTTNPRSLDATRAGAAGGMPVHLKALVLEQLALDFTDASVQPAVTVGVSDINGAVRGLSTVPDNVAEVDVGGRLDAQSTFAVKGRVQPFGPGRLVDLAVTNANTQLVPLTGYLEKYAGHPLLKGKVSTDLHYEVRGMELKAANRIRIDQLTLGPRNDSPDATSLPVKLGVALLKDSEGRIELDLPLSGRLDDPEFRLGPVVLKVVVNTIVKAAASPFKLLGALVGGGEELSFVEFTPGTTHLLEGGLEKLQKLSQALEKRPALGVEIAAGYDPVTDRAALASRRLEARLQDRYLEERRPRNRPSPPEPGAALAPEDHARLVREAFVRQFGTNVAAVLETNRLARAATNLSTTLPETAPAARPERSLLKRVTGIFGGGGAPPRSREEKRLPKADREALKLVTTDEMFALLVDQVPVPAEELAELAAARARAIQAWLVGEGAVAPDRVFLVAPRPAGPGAPGRSQATLSLN